MSMNSASNDPAIVPSAVQSSVNSANRVAEEAAVAHKDANYWGNMLSAVVYWIVFLAYALAAVVLLGVSWGRGPCYVQSTYRQEFVVNIVSNPFFTSSSVLKGAPLSKLEETFYNVSRFSQRAGDVIMFPNEILDVYNNSAFWPVVLKPHPMVAADEVIPSTKMDPGMYYFDPSTHDIIGSGIPVAGGAGTAFKNLVLSYVKGQYRAGMQLPNLLRCSRNHMKNGLDEKLFGTTLEDQAALTDMLAYMTKFGQRSHLRGTCLLSGQQPTVDMTSNYKTSMILFSSVNPLFMVALIMWITASFSLFYLGGRAKLPTDRNIHGWTLDDLCMIVAMVWNLILLVIVLVPTVQQNSNIPLNNVVMAVVALAAAIFVQWNWANFLMFDVEKHEQIAVGVVVEEGKDVVEPIKPDDLEHRIHNSGPEYSHAAPSASHLPASLASGPVYMEQADTAKPSQAQYYCPGRGGYSSVGASYTSLNTSNFLSTASAVKTYGVQYVRSMMEGSDGLRRRKAARSQAIMQTGSRMAMMPNYTAMVQLGDRFVMDKYISLLKREMLCDSVQSMEYTITTPLLSAVIVASVSPIINTGMVQWVLVCLLASHLLCVPIIYLSHMCSKYANSRYISFHGSAMGLGIALLLAAFIILQVFAFTIKLQSLTDSWAYYWSESILQSTVWGLFAMQLVFMITVLVVAAAALTGYAHDEYKILRYIANYSSNMYMLINLMIKLVMGCVLASAAVNQNFPVFSCDAWEGRYATASAVLKP